jgi:hypothetical protein
MKKVLNLLFFHIFLSIILFSCKKKEEKVITESFIYYELNGVPHTQKSKTDLTFTFAGKIQTTGEEKPSNVLNLDAPKLRMIVRDHEAVIQYGTYSGKTYYSSGYTKEVFMTYMHNNDTLYQSSYTNPITEVQINNISRDGVVGTFSCELIEPSYKDTLKITNGRFSIHTYK